jgi:hypothetical protein
MMENRPVASNYLGGFGGFADGVQFDATYSDDPTNVTYTVSAEIRLFGIPISRTQLAQETVSPAAGSTLTFEKTAVNNRGCIIQGIYGTVTVRDAAGNERTYSVFLDDTGDSKSRVR